ncbi:MAG: DUF349 domain-containing protein [Bacteroidia bacterium]|nr:DUF349 domain-containing protein [Bacteroidia bacterium]
MLEPSIRKAFITLQKLHDEWRETGPVPKEKKEEIWERFKETTTKINKKYQEYYIELKEEQKNNLAVKVHICEKIEEIAHQEINMIKDWQKKTLEIQELQKMWRTIGFAPKKYNTIIYERYKQSCDDFFNRKKEYFLQLQDEQQNNMQLKTDICMQAEALKDSTDWKKTTEDFINLQNKWKKIGHVQKKKSEALWTRFRTACNFFFERKAQFYSSIDSFLESNLKAKTGLIEKIEHFEPGDDNKQNLEMLKNFQKEWTDIGLVPVNKRYKLQEQFRDTINAKFDSLKLGAYEKSMIHFKSWIDEILKSPNSKEKLKFEKEKIVQKLKWLENDIVIWENNIGFFTNSKSAEALIKDVQNKIDSGKESVRILKAKLDIINKL